MLTNIDRQAMSSLRYIRNCFERSGQSFHQEHQKYCLKRSIDSDDEDLNERPNTRSQLSREIAIRNVDREIKTEDNHGESVDQASGGEKPNVEPKEEEEVEDDVIPIIRVPANQLMRAYMKIPNNRIKIEDHNKENISNGVKRERSNSLNIFDKSDDINETNICEPHKKKSRVSRKGVVLKDISRKISGKSNANTTNERNISNAIFEVNIAGNVRSGQTTLDKWISHKNKSNGNKDQKNRGINGQTKEKKTNIQRSQSLEVKQKISSDVRTHNGEKPHQCDRCKKRFSRKYHLNTHIRRHTGEKPYQCDQDKNKKKFVTIAKAALEGHMRIHTGAKPFKCGRCKKRFNTKTSLTRHIRCHTGEKPYQCDQCEKRFNRRHHLQYHMRTHKDKKPYRCDQCKKRFNQKSSLNLHIRRHTGEKPFQCGRCKRRFTQKPHLNSHMKTHNLP
ncbi:zinc finger protein 37 homolog [Contarinia nasturtii]|uniref:zinc finger protein 37 homolog n=1 Tax=Contarinia nasturtii TaxID=265458 RepID=UPI0012D49E42|nr:zinc finger protein 37 homolog [Contarinia nasturtii]